MRFSLRQKIASHIRFMLLRAVNKGLTVGGNVYLGRGSSVSAIYELSIANNVYIGKNVSIEIQGKIGSGVLIANNVGIIGRRDHDHTTSDNGSLIFFAKTVRENRALSEPTIIEDGVWIGFGAIVLSGVTIGRRSVVAAGSVVTVNVPSGVVVAGNPAKVVKKLFHDDISSLCDSSSEVSR
jgi:acetyltransferase-like isoleucine patch superfamily enzyme